MKTGNFSNFLRLLGGPFVALSILSLVLVGCGEPTATPIPPTATPLPENAATIAKQAAEKLKTVNALHFLVDIKSGQVEVYQGITFKRAEGDYSKPDKYRARLRVSVVSAQVDAEIVGLPDKQWLLLKNLSNSWTELPPNVGFKASVLFDPVLGLGAVVTKMQNAQLAGSETLDGVEVYHIKGIVEGSDIAPITSNTLGKNKVDFDAWIGKSDSLVRKVTLKEIVTTGEPSFWELTFSKFDEPVNIVSPVKS